jgi:hypothetical protein
MDFELVKALADGGIGLAVLVGGYYVLKHMREIHNMYMKTINNHIAHDTEAKVKQTEALGELTSVIKVLSEKVSKDG